MNVDPVRPRTAAPIAHFETVIDLQVRRYARARRRRTGERLARQSRHRLSGEAAEIVRFALIWAPYGGAPADETFQKFGMSMSRFVETLWQTVEGTGLDLRVTNQLATIYPRRTVLGTT